MNRYEKSKLKSFIYRKLTYLRDRGILTSLIDWIRYEYFIG